MRPALLTLCLTLGWFASSSLAHAAEDAATLLDPRIKSVEYDPLGIVPLAGFFGFATLVEFDPAERVESVVAGYGDAWEVVNLGNMITVKPRRVDADTNLAVITNKRVYSFALTLSPSARTRFAFDAAQPTFLLRFHYREERADGDSIGLPDSGLKTNLDQDLTVAVGDNRDYTYSGEVNLVPHAAWDDGRFTYLTFSAEQDLPAVFVVNADNSESLVNKIVSGDTVVIEHLARQFVLRLGQSVACIFNERDVTRAIPRSSHTTSDTVRRTVVTKERP